MKLYTFAPAANALRVEMFLREKELKLETISVNVREDELFKEPYNSMNPFNCIPFLELENGTIITETISICRYLDEQSNSSKLFGNDSEERAIIDMWNRRIELDGFLPLLHSVRNKTSFFKGIFLLFRIASHIFLPSSSFTFFILMPVAADKVGKTSMIVII